MIYLFTDDDDTSSIASFFTNSTNSKSSTSSTSYTSSSFKSNKKQNGKFKQSLLPKYVIRNITKTEIPIFHDLLVKMTVANG